MLRITREVYKNSELAFGKRRRLRSESSPALVVPRWPGLCEILFIHVGFSSPLCPCGNIATKKCIGGLRVIAEMSSFDDDVIETLGKMPCDSIQAVDERAEA
jgi:hypothetical protein